MISFLTAPAHRPIERQTTIRLVAGNSSVIRAQSYQISIEIPLNFHHFIEISTLTLCCTTMNDDKRQRSLQLIVAIEENDTATASSLIKSGSVNLNGESLPLHSAVGFGRVEIMAMLLDAGGDINAVDKYHRTASHVAIWLDQFEALKLLVERGANLGVVDSDGYSLLSIVAKRGRDERFTILLLDAGAPLDGLSNDLVLMLVKSVAVFDRLMARGVNFTAMRDLYGAMLCHRVASNVTSEDVLRFLVKVCGNDAVHAGDSLGKTPLHWASSSGNSNGNESAVRVLVELGADIDRQDNWGRCALIDAAGNMQSSCVLLLIALGADVDVVTNDGRTACHRAARYADRRALSALVAAGGNLDQCDNKGETPRMIAAQRNVALPTADEIDAARQRIAKTRLDLVRQRAFRICVALQSFRLSALQLCEILMHSFGALGSLILFHQWWAIAVKVKHFRDRKQQSSTRTTSTSATNNETQ
jgi:ankyrin repeat protein